MDIAKFIDHTLLKADATKADVKRICNEAIKYKFKSVCVNSSYTEFVRNELEGTEVKVCTVVGFPLGAMDIESKAFEAKRAIEMGTDEIDMVINIGALKDKDYDYVSKDIKAVVDVAKGKALVKVILENCLLTKEEIVKGCELLKEAGVDFVKTSTGFSKGGATIEDIKLMRETVGSEIGVKASGGVRTNTDAIAVISAGASRIGASSSINIIECKKSTDNSY